MDRRIGFEQHKVMQENKDVQTHAEDLVSILTLPRERYEKISEQEVLERNFRQAEKDFFDFYSKDFEGQTDFVINILGATETKLNTKLKNNKISQQIFMACIQQLGKWLLKLKQKS